MSENLPNSQRSAVDAQGQNSGEYKMVALHLMRMAEPHPSFYDIANNDDFGASKSEHMLGYGVLGYLGKDIINKRGLKKLLEGRSSAKAVGLSDSTLKKLIAGKNKYDKPISLAELRISPKKGQMFIDKIEKYAKMHGQQSGGSINLAGMGFFKKTKDFFTGKTKVKPSDILGGVTSALEIASIIPSPVSGTLGIAGKVSKATESAVKKAGAGIGENEIEEQNNSKICPKGNDVCKCPSGSGDSKNQQNMKLSSSTKKSRVSKRHCVVGTKEEVWSGEKEKTSSGLKKGDLMQNKNGKIISKKKHAQGKKIAQINGFQKKN